ncbi:hypothetical protein N8J89_20245 [Crossiella sp. CA-258035]|uniref:hypothetical protein n=1 Tax=Crossiella sp. CA-258035 TaxID=2981138 RepID=UPI0024BC62B2|nr:hypothetical protein [Crossiella sp. CA-258035]WHT23316.1 hypothetical protein N8J89_20245 [Crossiella sp. CA-258035]
MTSTHCERHGTSRRWCRDCRQQRLRGSMAEPKTWTVTPVAETGDDTAVAAALIAGTTIGNTPN